mmetsp:Transcript_8014/g.17106  ORF Transcript_8014/g.17106 Transcript_8014/m.17106 type:complete len:392 (-) Transcript_8014:1440-2615(-)
MEGEICNEYKRRVLSIQSHVVSGYVGNKAAVFPLQLLGFDVDIINSVDFSNHTGYPNGWEGSVMDGDTLLKMVDGLERNGLLLSDFPEGEEEFCGKDGDGARIGRIGNVLTGYIGSESFLHSVVTVVQKLKALNPKCRYVCDPVLGDRGKFYVPPELVDIYKKEVLPLADVITPNQFEIEQLTGIDIQTIADAQNACRILHNLGVSLVLITSIIFPGTEINDPIDNTMVEKPGDGTEATPPPNSIGMFVSRRITQQKTMCQTMQQQNIDSEQEQHCCEEEQYVLYTPKLPGFFTGTGDVCAALCLGWTAELNDHVVDDGLSLGDFLEKLAGTMHAIVQRTAQNALKKQSRYHDDSSRGEKSRKVSSFELKLIQSRDDILQPPRSFRAVKLQ